MTKNYDLCLILGLLVILTTIPAQMIFAAPSFELEFGEEGDANDELDGPLDVVVNGNGDMIFVVDTGNDRINVFDEDGDDLFNFDESNDSGNLDNPMSIARDGDFIYVVDNNNNRILKIDIDGNCDENDDEGFAEDICFVTEFGSSSSSDDEYLPNAQGIAIHEDSGFVYVSDSQEDAILVFDDDGNFEFSFSESNDSGSFANPSSLAIDNDRDILYVADTSNDRIVIIDIEGNCDENDDEGFAEDICFIDEFDEGDDSFNSISGLTFDDSENMLYVADSSNNQIAIFEMISSGSCPSGTDEIVDEVCFVEEFGSSGSSDGRFDSPSGLSIDSSNDLLYVANA